MKVKNLSFNKFGEFRSQKFVDGNWYDVIIYRVGKRFKKWIQKVGSEFPLCDCWISANDDVDVHLFFNSI